jgi:hypothetical protein
MSSKKRLAKALRTAGSQRQRVAAEVEGSLADYINLLYEMELESLHAQKKDGDAK